ncbi:MAG: dihydrofolate reductase [Bdellovibrionaceae bacterium]|nr:dihydrofolate reductase [Pseudobdellovibrionaceae bacterium]
MNSNITLSHITAVDQNNGIGINGELPWNIPKDMEFFKTTTQNKIIIMGRKTFDSIHHPLPNRLNIVISRSKHTHPSKQVLFVSSINDAITEAKKHTAQYDKEVFVIGGAEIYKQSLSLVDRIYITRIAYNYNCDAFYPSISEKEFKKTSSIEHRGNPDFSFLTLERL